MGPLLDAHGLRRSSDDGSLATFENDVVRLQVAFDPRGEVDLRVARRSCPTAGVWTFTGIVGRASVTRLLELAAEELVAEPKVLSGDPAYFDALASAQADESAQWTAYYSRRGPRPKTGQLP